MFVRHQDYKIVEIAELISGTIAAAVEAVQAEIDFMGIAEDDRCRVIADGVLGYLSSIRPGAPKKASFDSARCTDCGQVFNVMHQTTSCPHPEKS